MKHALIALVALLVVALTGGCMVCPTSSGPARRATCGGGCDPFACGIPPSPAIHCHPAPHHINPPPPQPIIVYPARPEAVTPPSS